MSNPAPSEVAASSTSAREIALPFLNSESSLTPGIGLRYPDSIAANDVESMCKMYAYGKRGAAAVPRAALVSAKKCLCVMAQVIGDECLDEPVAVIVAGMSAQGEALTGIAARLFE